MHDYLVNISRDCRKKTPNYFEFWMVCEKPSINNRITNTNKRHAKITFVVADDTGKQK